MGARKRDKIIGGLSQKHKDAISAAMIEKRLWAHASGEIELDATKVRSLEALLDRRKPKLASIDMTAETRVSYVDTLRSIAEQAGWATAAVQVAMESHESDRNAALHTSDNESDATSDTTQGTD